MTKGRDTADSSKATKCKDTTDSSKLNGKGKDNTDSPKANKGRNNRKRSSKDLVSKGHTISKEQKTAKTEIEKLCKCKHPYRLLPRKCPLLSSADVNISKQFGPMSDPTKIGARVLDIRIHNIP